jgi:hexosaminidase
VQFSVDGVNRGAPVALAGGVADLPSIASLLPGSHGVLATYSGDMNFYGGTGGLTQVVTCTRTITGSHTGSLLVGPGSVCILDATISGSVQARPGSAVYVARSTIKGSVSEDKGVAFAMCGSNVVGSTLITRTKGSVLIGDGGDNGSFGCAGNTIGGTLSISKTTGSAEASGNRVGGAISLSDTTSNGVPPDGVPQLEGNQITSGLACLRNAPAPVNGGQPNTAGGVKSGQCTTL